MSENATIAAVDQPRQKAERQTTANSSTEKLDELYRDYADELWSRFYAWCNDSERAMDAVQEAFLRLHREGIDDIRKPKAWLLNVGRNWLRDSYRRRANSEQTLVEGPALIHVNESPCAALIDDAEGSEIREGLDQLSAADREVLVLRYGMSWNSKRIAKCLGKTATGVDMHLTRARRRLLEAVVSLRSSLDTAGQVAAGSCG